MDKPSYEELQNLCAEIYQVIGEMSYELGIFDSESVGKILDNLNDVASGRILSHKTLLPFSVQNSNKQGPNCQHGLGDIRLSLSQQEIIDILNDNCSAEDKIGKLKEILIWKS